MEFLENINENKTKEKNSSLLHGKHKKQAVRCRRLGFQILERECAFFLDFPPFEPSILDGARSKVDLRCEGYAWAPILLSSENFKR